MDFDNVYDDGQRAEAYAKLEFPGTYYLAYRDVPEIIAAHVTGKSALDFGCGAGRSTRFLEAMGFNTIGVDISEDMIKQAHARDPQGDYRLIEERDFSQLEENAFDLILAAFTFDNIPSTENKTSLLKGLGKLLRTGGKIVNLVSSPDIYLHEWASFTTKDFPENKTAISGDRVKIIMTDVEDQRPVEDILCTDDSYRNIYERAELELVKTYKPLGKENETIQWVNETRIAPWVIYVLNKP